MANISALNSVISELFTVIGTIITNMVDLLTGDLLVLAIVGAFVTMIVGIIYFLLNYVKGSFSNSIKMK